MKVLIAGDFCPQQRVADCFENEDYSGVLGKVKLWVEDADYSLVNFECPVCKGCEEPIEKSGPNLKCTEKGVEAVKWGGFDCVTLANNHFLDYGKEGVDNTLSACAKYGIDTVGGGKNLQEASKILYKEFEGQVLAIINCCEYEFSVATESTPGSNPLNPIQQYYAIKEARRKSDYVLLIVHGGHEHYQYPSLRMKEIYRFFIDSGADAVVNHHQHCYSGYEVYQGKPIFYGIGNFCFDYGNRRKSKWNEGYMVMLDFNSEITRIDKILPYVQCDELPEISIMEDKDRDKLLSHVEKINRIISDDNLLYEQYGKFVSESKINYDYLFSVWSNKYLIALFNRNLLPRFMSKQKKMELYNYLVCPSHYDNLKKLLNKLLFDR